MIEINDGIYGWLGEDFNGSLFGKNYLYCCLFVYLEFFKNLGYGEMKMLF